MKKNEGAKVAKKQRKKVETPKIVVPKMKTMKIGDLVPYVNNAKRHTDEQIAMIAESIKARGFFGTVVVDSEGVIVVGHGRVAAAEKAGMKEIPVQVADHLSADEIRAHRLADNRLAEITDLDPELAKIELETLRDNEFENFFYLGYSEDELIAAFEQSKDAEETFTEPDEVPEPPKVPVSVKGDVWLLGKHRVMCGDSTVLTDVERLMDGKKADMVFTDPPYGVNYTGGAKKRVALANDNTGTKIYDDALPLLRVAAADHAALYLWYADANIAAAAAAAAAAGYIVTAQIIWVKNNAQFVSAAHYHGKHEPCLFAHRKGKSAKWYGPNNEVTVWDVDRANKNEYHPTQKPVALAERACGNSSKSGDLVLDLFGGSGSTLIACEKTGRVCRMMELDPLYVDVIVKRWQDFTGKQATHEETGKKFDDCKQKKVTA